MTDNLFDLVLQMRAEQAKKDQEAKDAIEQEKKARAR
jgi:hypothetical protein